MIILHISDLHCEIYMLEKLLSTGINEKIDVIVFTGDSECNGETIDLLSKAGKPVFFVPGNMDDVAVSKAFEEANMNIDGKLVKYNDYYLAGIGGLSFTSSLDTIREKLNRNVIKYPLILVSHHPPKNGVTDKARIGVSAGLVELRNLINDFKPLLHLHGHIHESAGFTLIGETLVVNPGPLKNGRYALVYLKEKRAELLSLYQR